MKSGRKGHTFTLIQIKIFCGSMLMPYGIIVSVRPEPLPECGFVGIGFNFQAVRNARHSVNLFLLRRV